MEGGEGSERRATKSWVWARARAEERVPMCRIRFVCKSKELGGGGASGLAGVGGADGIFVRPWVEMRGCGGGALAEVWLVMTKRATSLLLDIFYV